MVIVSSEDRRGENAEGAGDLPLAGSPFQLRTVFLLLRMIRPQQWTKNVFCLAGVVFGGRFAEPHSWQLALATMAVFCLLSSSSYICNDIADRKRDRMHPRKRHRVIASGAISVPVAVVASVLLAAIALAGGYLLGHAVLLLLVLYVALCLAYTLFMKHIAIVDVICIGWAFIIRLVAGIYVLGDQPTAWIVLCSFFLAVFLGFAKRRAELNSLEGEGPLGTDRLTQRPVLREYTRDYLDFLVSSSATVVIICYALFATASMKNPSLVVTVPFVYFAIMDYCRLVILSGAGERPEWDALMNGRIILCTLLWFGTYMLVWRSQIALFR